MKNNQMPTWVMLWLTVLIGALVVFFANPAAVDRLFESVGLNRVLYPGKDSSPYSAALATSLPQTNQNNENKKMPLVSEEQKENDSSELVPFAQETLDQDSDSSQPPEEKQESNERVSDRLLYFFGLDPEGRSVLFSFKRELQEGMTPLAASLKALLSGPTVQEKNQGAFTLIPQGVRLLSLRIHHKTAFLSFNQDFLSNPYGLEGFVGQLKQIVWTATQFLSVDQVQFLIDGQQRDFLAEEGLSIAAPFHRSSLP